MSDDWQTMDTAPRDGTFVELVNMDLNVGPWTMRWNGGLWISEHERVAWSEGTHGSPTHWCKALEAETTKYLEVTNG